MGDGFDGVGDDDVSWGVDGSNSTLWHKGSDHPWAVGKAGSSWEMGDVIGFAAAIDDGKIAVSKNGSWSQADGLGVIFESSTICEGVFPALTPVDFRLRCTFGAPNHSNFAFPLPPASV